MSGNLTPPIPVIGKENSIEDPVIKESLEYLRNHLNAVLNNENKIDPSLFAGGGLTSQYFKPTVGTTALSTTGSMTLTEGDLPGTEKAIQVAVNSLLFAWYTFDIENFNNSRTTCIGNFKVDNTVAGAAIYQGGTEPGSGASGRATVGNFTLMKLTPGEHKLKLSQIYSTAAGHVVPTMFAGNTKLAYLLVAE